MESNAIDFEGTGVNTPETKPQTKETPNDTQTDTTPLDGKPEADDITGKDNTKPQDGETQPNADTEKNDVTELEEGTVIELDNNTYTVDKDGNIVDKDGKVVVEKANVANWVKENNLTDDTQTETNTNDLSIDSIRDAIGLDVFDDKENIVEFENTPKGVADYVNAVIQSKEDEIQEATINKFFADYPVVKDFFNYVQINGSGEGYGNIRDRSKIQLDKDNEAQQEAVIILAANEFGNKSLNQNYINYLKSTGRLYEEAKAQLDALVAADKEEQKQREIEAANIRKQQDEYYANITNKYIDLVKGRKVKGYTLPETIIKKGSDGKNYTYNLDDFINYALKPTVKLNNGQTITQYQADSNNVSLEDKLQNNIIQAWLMFTGGSYKDLLDIAVKEDNVRKLIAKSNATKTQKTLRVKSPKKTTSIDDIILS